MESLFVVVSSLILALFLPFAFCSLIVSHCRRLTERVGLGPLDRVISLNGSCRILRGAKVIADSRKTMSGFAVLMFIGNLTVGMYAGPGPLIVVWFCEFIGVALAIDFFNKSCKKCSVWPIGE